MSAPLISCVVPVYNGERFLAEALDSVLAQTYRPVEILVSDDGSTDGTHEVAARYSKQIRYLRHANAGPGAARNRGLEVAQGDFVALLDADDVWHPEKLERQMARFQRSPDLDVCVTHFQNFWASEMVDEEEQPRDHPLLKPWPGYAVPTMLARHSVFTEKVGLYDEQVTHGENTEWFLRAAEQDVRIDLLPDVLVRRRLYDDNFTRRDASQHWDAFFRVMKQQLDLRRRLGRRETAFPGFPKSTSSQ
jgi:glycosyltransferase involved in cell wall biosynthesis